MEFFKFSCSIILDCSETERTRWRNFNAVWFFSLIPHLLRIKIIITVKKNIVAWQLQQFEKRITQRSLVRKSCSYDQRDYNCRTANNANLIKNSFRKIIECFINLYIRLRRCFQKPNTVIAGYFFTSFTRNYSAICHVTFITQ